MCTPVYCLPKQMLRYSGIVLTRADRNVTDKRLSFPPRHATAAVRASCGFCDLQDPLVGKKFRCGRFHKDTKQALCQNQRDSNHTAFLSSPGKNGSPHFQVNQ
ncbi:hypothetical protein AVEN_119280-1 [Araneus ventricosus]|uniref:Uncharacterized protein n=1 Tax=Araneus ventricosus TaxID=182803 RepID=A0A4Y2EG72_ARAVE|nr:hypothetical protein AVEN_119280-1 [Araneus ventricosus]